MVFGGPSPEHDVSILTGLQATRALTGAPGVDAVHALYWSRDGRWFEVPPELEASAYLDGVPARAIPCRLCLAGPREPGGGFLARRGRLAGREAPVEVDAVVVCCHGGPGEDGTLQGALDLAGIAYTGPSAAGASLGMDKLAFSNVVAAAGLPILPRVALERSSGDPSFAGPYIVKPRYGGSSIGIDVVEDLATARARLAANAHLGRGAVLEPYRPELYDLQIAARSWPEPELSAIERPLRSAQRAEILGYLDKYVGGEGMASAPRELPAEISDGLAASLRAAAEIVASVVGLRGVARIDFLSDGTELFVNEINTIPGSLARYLWVQPPRSFPLQLFELLDEAVRRPAAEHSAAGADGAVLRSAGSIASKLL